MQTTYWILFGSSGEVIADCFFDAKRDSSLAETCLYRIGVSLRATVKVQTPEPGKCVLQIDEQAKLTLVRQSDLPHEIPINGTPQN